MGRLILCGLAVALGLQAQAPIVVAVSNDSWSSPIVSPGGIGYVLGFNFGAAGNVTVTVGGLDARVLFASNGQIRAQFPPNLPAGPALLRVTVDGMASLAVTVMVAPNLKRVMRGEGSVSDGPAAGLSSPLAGHELNTQNAGGGGIVYTCDPTVTAQSATACNVLNTTIAGLYSAAFSNVSAQIYIKLGSTTLGHSSYVLNLPTYSAYRNALIANETDANDATALAVSVPATSPYPSDQLLVTNALARALGLPVNYGFLTDGATFCTPGTAGCYDGVITVSNSKPLYFRSGSITGSQYDFFTVVEHETDEILGTASCSFGTCGSGYIQPPDFFRYHSNGTRSFAAGANNSCSSSDSSNACFSLDGVHMLQQYNNLSNGNDAGDWSNGCANQLVQDTNLCSGTAGLDISAAAEILVLDAIGYTLASSGAVTNVTSSTANGTYGAGTSLSIQVTFNTTVTVTGSPQLALNSGGTATYSSGSGTSTLTFTYLVAAGQNSSLLDYTSANALTLNGGAIAGPGNSTPSLALASPGAAGSLSGGKNIAINTATGNVTIQTAPPGLQFSVDGGAAQTAPRTVTLSQGTHPIAVAATQAGPAGTQYVLTGWSDSGAATHTITVGPGASSYTASFKTQYQLTLSAQPPAGGTATPASGKFYDAATLVTIVATANTGYTFANWTGSVAGPNSASTTVTMSGPLTVSANFAQPLLSIALAHSGNLARDQLTATYTATVSNAPGAGSTSGTVTVAEVVPSGLTLVSLAGTGWTCPAGGATCTRNDVLNAGASYAAITVTVRVASNAPAQVTNQSTVSGGSSANASANDLTNVSLSLCDVDGDGVTTIVEVQRITNEVLGSIPAVHDLNQDGAVNVLDIQIMTNAALGLGCAAK